MSTEKQKPKQQQTILDLCLQPTTNRETFFKDYFLKKPLHTKMPGRFDRQFRLSDLEFLWNTTMQVDPSSMLFFHQQSHPEGPITSLRSAFFAFAQISVVVNKADRLSPSILKICKNFEEHFPFVFCNVYSTPAGERTVPVHVDDRDVFILQVHGAKHWTIYDSPPVVLPYKSEELGKNQPHSPSPDKFDEKTAKVAFEGVVEAGDVVYLPRGFAHVAKAVEHSASVHLTIAVQTSDWDVNAILKDGIESIMSSITRKGALSGNELLEKSSSTPEEFGLRTVLPPSLLAQKKIDSDKNDNGEEEKSTFTKQLQSSLQLVVKQLSENPLQVCMDQFNSRLALKRQRRDEYFEENVSEIRFFPLQMSSLILWSSAVQIVQVQPLRDEIMMKNKKIGNISHGVILQKKRNNSNSNNSGDEDFDSMQLTVSSTILEIMFLWQKHFTECPAPVSEMLNPIRRSSNSTNNNKNNSSQQQQQQQDCSLSALCTAGFLVRNGCLVRVS